MSWSCFLSVVSFSATAWVNVNWQLPVLPLATSSGHEKSCGLRAVYLSQSQNQITLNYGYNQMLMHESGVFAVFPAVLSACSRRKAAFRENRAVQCLHNSHKRTPLSDVKLGSKFRDWRPKSIWRAISNRASLLMNWKTCIFASAVYLVWLGLTHWNSQIKPRG